MKNHFLPFLIFLLFFSRLHAQIPGSLDLSFGGVGYVTKDVLNEINFTKLIFLQPDGKIVSLGNSGNSFDIKSVVALRHNGDGTIDSGFGVSGVFREAGFGYPTSSIQYCELWSGALQPDGKIVLAGMIQVLGAGSYIFLIRLNANGKKDTSFGINGIFSTPVINYAEPRGKSVKIVVLSDGKIMLFTGVKTSDKFSLLRLNADGTLDSSFGIGGLLDIPSSLGPVFSIYAIAMTVQSDGKILAQGVASTAPSSSKGYIFRFLQDGTLDNTFSSNGELLISDSHFGDNLERKTIIQLPDGKILISSSAGISRYKSDGTIDNTFGTNGTEQMTLSFFAMISQMDGKIICVGAKSGQGIVIRRNANGSMDQSFGNNGGGYVTIPQSSIYFHVLQQPDGKLVACGKKDSDFLLGRHFLQAVSSATEAEIFQQFSLSPNPSQNEITVRFKLDLAQTLSIALYNLSGQLVQTMETETLFAEDEHEYHADISNVPTGYYVLKIQGQKGEKAYKIQVLKQD